ncbi:unnamed protein product [Toxocara canis]|uniref:Kinesin motor domain-containing protein n=1 Tax=Toxocara canis TaxID=6265 RepID=A0A183U8P3_TOXCA|nr:unnamed protein product [Toxocara canis]
MRAREAGQVFFIPERNCELSDVNAILFCELSDLGSPADTFRTCVEAMGEGGTSNINQSLLTLGRVIKALTSGAGHIPYRLLLFLCYL